MPRRIVITGASSGLGAAFALHYAAPQVHLGLIGRDAGRLDIVAEQCRARGASVTVGQIDVRDRAAVAEWLGDFDKQGPIDLLIANAGIALGGRGVDGVFADRVHEEIRTNLDGVLHTMLPLLPAMMERGAGQIALISSVAALSPLADAPGYSAGKAALLSFGLAMRERVYRRGVRINVACPGFVKTPMGERYRGWRPLEMTAEEAARRIARGLARDKAIIAFPFALVALARLGRLVPEPVRRAGQSLFRFDVRDQSRRS
jgi:short-subunit dehydrogenase